MGAIKNVSIVDMGGNGKDGGGVGKFAATIPQTIAAMVANAQAMGIDVKPLLKLAKLDASKLSQMIGMVDQVLPSEEPVAAPTTDQEKN